MLRKSILVRALSIAFATAALAAAVSQPALAQSNASGNIFGRVDAPAGATVTLSNTETGLKRTVTPDASGRYQATAMPPGHYKVDLVRDGNVAQTSEIDVLVGQGVEASFVAAAVQQVQVNGRRSRIDVSSANNGATFTAKELAALPIAQSVDAIIQLAPNTTRADPRYAAGASFGGGGASENSYYINGFPVTNPLTQLGASELPFGAIAQAQILTGGFGAEFGRSVGGVVNITTKSGTNTWEAGAQYSIEPASMRAKARDVYYPNTGDPANKLSDGTLYARNSVGSQDSNKLGAYVGGPIIQDKLFMFVAAEQKVEKISRASGTAATTSSNLTQGWLDEKDTTSRFMGKFDWNITDNHRLEWTTINDKPETDLAYSGYDLDKNVRLGSVVAGGHYQNIANVTPTTGAKTNILKYTGNLTDDLTVTALYGKNRTDHVQNLMGYNPTVPGVLTSTESVKVPGQVYSNPAGIYAGTNVGTAYSYDEVKSQRLDLEYKLGSHTLRAGLDNNKLSSADAGVATAGGSTWVYAFTSTPNVAHTLNGKSVIIANGGGHGTDGYYVYRSIFADITAAGSNQSAQYIEDKWQVNRNLLVTAGLRNEQYKNINGDGATFLEVNNQLNPRFSAAWDVNGDASLKVFGSAGRYSIQIPTHVAVRGASVSTLTREYFTYTGVDPVTGAPTGLVNLTPVTSSDNEFGQVKLPQTVAAQNLRPSFQDEITLGFEQAFSPNLNYGVKMTYRKLKSTIDDFCDQRPFDSWAAAHSVDTSNWSGFTCASINPGETNNFLVDFSGTGKNLTPVTLTAADMGFDTPSRIYKAVDVFFEHPLRNGWYGKVNYTWSVNRGNTEGQTLSGIAQTDVAATQTWDHRELMEYADGLLPNDRTHQIKAFGYWEVQPRWTVGANLLIASGQPITCLGNYPDSLQANDPGFPDYGSAYHYCGTNGANVPSPSGAAGRLPWDVRLDMDLVYKPAFLAGLALKMDVFNVFNKQTLQQIDQTYNSGTGAISPTYGMPGSYVGYTQPRNVRFTAEYNHRF
jgi:hypothetical protein